MSEPQEPCQDPDCPVVLLHTHPWLKPNKHQPLGIRSTDVGSFIRCACGRNPTPKYWLETHWGDDKAEGKRLVDALLGEHSSNPRGVE